LNRVRIRRPYLDEDIAEHRHIAQTIRLIVSHVANIAKHFDEMVRYLYADIERWGAKKNARLSVFEQKSLPKIELLEAYATRARGIACKFRQLISTYSFLGNAQAPRTQFGPTPIFCYRPAYREVYLILTDARKKLGILVDGESIPVFYRNIAQLYEYWCFAKTVNVLRERFGSPESDAAIKLIHGIYRPDLEPGQKFIFNVNARTTLTVYYEPDILPFEDNMERNGKYAATLTSNPLRPDILLELCVDGRSPVLMILDAKSTDRFDHSKLWLMTDYARQIFLRKSMIQPVKCVFILHRDEHTSICNVPKYFNLSNINPHVVVLGAIPFVPRAGDKSYEKLRKAIDIFVASQLEYYPFESDQIPASCRHLP
jgi:hypothetical protein